MGKYISCAERRGQGRDFELILTVKMKSRHLVEGQFSSYYRRTVIIAESHRPGVAWPGIFVINFCVFEKTPYSTIFIILFRQFSSPYWSTSLCWNFVKFIRQEIGEIVRYLPHKQKKQKFGCLSNCRYCADRAQNLPEQAPDNVLTVLQISSKSVHFRRSYSRTREHRCFAL